LRYNVDDPGEGAPVVLDLALRQPGPSFEQQREHLFLIVARGRLDPPVVIEVMQMNRQRFTKRHFRR
jgi:hypothetical protein